MTNKEIEILKLNFPEYFDKNGNFLLEKFKENLAENEISLSTESYGMDWLGKSYARLLASDSVTTWLKEDKVHNSRIENKNSENLLIKGDNLEVLKHFVGAYSEKVKMIYIDPPYNTGGDGFVYNDDRKFTIEQLQELAGVSEEKAKQILAFTKSNSNSHSAWLTFMYPRLYIARQLLKEDGVIFVSIDDNEVAQLRLLMDEIFGEENFVAELIWKSKSGGANDSNHFAIDHEYVLCYGKDISLVNLHTDKNGKVSTSYNLEDENGKYALERLDKQSIRYSKSGDYEIKDDKGNVYYPSHKDPERPNATWRWGKNKVRENFHELVFKDNHVYTKNYEKDGTKSRSLLIDERFGRTRTGKTDFTQLFDVTYFSSPKPIKLIGYLSQIITSNNDLILDFFAGSGTTGDAIMQLNTEDGGNRKYILVQLPEVIDAKKNKVAYDFVTQELKAEPTIFEITKERLKRAAAKIKQEKPDYKGDLGFKIFETSPIPEDFEFEAKELNPLQELFDTEKLTQQDLENLLITWKTEDSIPLTQDLESIDLAGYKAYYGNNKLYLMDKEFTTEHLIALLEKIDNDKAFNITTVYSFGFNFESKSLREIDENIKVYKNKKGSDIDFIKRYYERY